MDPVSVTADAATPPQDAGAEAPVVDTATHRYLILPVEHWPAAAAFVASAVDPDAAFPNPDSPDSASVLAAVSKASGEIEGVLIAKREILIDHFACTPSSGVSYASFHELIQRTLPVGTVYYTAVGGSVGARRAANHAGLRMYGLLAATQIGA